MLISQVTAPQSPLPRKDPECPLKMLLCLKVVPKDSFNFRSNRFLAHLIERKDFAIIDLEYANEMPCLSYVS